MTCIVFELDLTPYHEEFCRLNNYTLPPALEYDEWAQQVLLSILHQHCILMLTGNACTTYYSAPIQLKNQIDEVVESVITDGTNIHWLQLSRAINGLISVREVRIRRHKTFEVYCD